MLVGADSAGERRQSGANPALDAPAAASPAGRLAPGALLLTLIVAAGCMPRLLARGGPHPDLGGITSVRAPFMQSLVYVVPVDGGVVLVDAGLPRDRAAILKAVGDREVLGILLTHGHVDHAAGIAAWDVPVWLGAADLPTLRGAQVEPAVLPELGWLLLPRPAADRVIEVDDGAVVRFGSTAFTAVSLPGHTPGSTAWLLGDVLFTGDALHAPWGEFTPPSWVYTGDSKQAWQSLGRLRGVPFRVVLDGHYGRTDDAHAALLRRLGEGPPADPFFGFVRREDLTSRW